MSNSSHLQCPKCNYVFTLKRNLYAHMRKVHLTPEEDVDLIKLKMVEESVSETLDRRRSSRILCPECKMNCNTYKLLRIHLSNQHNISLICEEVSFSSMEDFESWKETFERKTFTHYVLNTASKTLGNGEEKRYYHCHRSHNFVSRGQKKRSLKFHGSNKINAACPSTIELLIKEYEVLMTFWATHVGHSLDIVHTFLDKKSRTEIAGKLQQGATFQTILDDVRGSLLNDDNIERIHLIKRKDLHNIVRNFNIDYPTQHHQNDSVPNENVDESNDGGEVLQILNIVPAQNESDDSNEQVIKKLDTIFELCSTNATQSDSELNKIHGHLDAIINVLNKGQIDCSCNDDAQEDEKESKSSINMTWETNSDNGDQPMAKMDSDVVYSLLQNPQETDNIHINFDHTYI